MKLIDVDTLDDYLGKWADDFYENPENSDADFMDGYCMTLNRIHSGAVPEVDAEPVRHGKWIPVDSYSAYGGDEATWNAHGNPVAFHYCSECKEQAYANEDGEDILSAYCPQCGAKMEAEQDE